MVGDGERDRDWCRAQGHHLCLTDTIFMPPTSKKLRGHIGLGLSVRLSVRPSVRLSVRPSVRLSVRNTFWKLRNSRTPYARILKFYIWHIHEK